MAHVLNFENYPFLKEYTTPVKKAERDIVGRDKEIFQILAAFKRPELCNVILLAEAGCGKTALVQGTMLYDTDRRYLEVDLSKMIANLSDSNEMASKLKMLFDEVSDYCFKYDVELVLFMDEFHQIVQLSDAAVEALKPLLADSGTRGIRVIAATTYEEFRKHISPNQPLVERLQRISLKQPDEDLTVKILKGMAVRYGVDNQFYDDSIFKLIYEYTNRYVPANSQPRKSILVLDSMVGWHRFDGRKMDVNLLADVIAQQENVNVVFSVDARSIKSELDNYVLSQQFASSVIEDRLQICVADLNDKRKPMSTMLFTGSTGVGKLVADYEHVPVFSDNGVFFKRHGDLVKGDFVFSRLGKPTLVENVFPHDDVPMYRVYLEDGRSLDVGSEHLWAVYDNKSRQDYENGFFDIKPVVMSTKQIFDSNDKYYIPMNEAIMWPEYDYKISPYAMGVFIGSGRFNGSDFYLSGIDKSIMNELMSELGEFFTFHDEKLFVDRAVLSEISEFFGISFEDRFIPDIYKYGSIDQRMDLIRGFFDSDIFSNVLSSDESSVIYSTSSERLAYDIRSLLFSLGVSNVHSKQCYNGVLSDKGFDLVEHFIHVNVPEASKFGIFTLPSKRAIIDNVLANNVLDKSFFMTVGIKDIKFIGYQSAQCIYVDNDEHLYQAGQFVVTHNTEMSKQLARILFDDDRNLLRFDMTEYANVDSLERFRDCLTTRVWERPYSIILLDEIEKACAPVTRLLLQVLDDGRLSDRNGRETSFINSYIILTTNAGSEIYKTIAKYNPDDEGSGKIMKKYDSLIRRSLSETTGDNRFPPELLGRIDVIVPFQPLSRDTQKRIVMMKLKKLKSEVMKKHGALLKVTPRVIDYLVEDNMTIDSDGGGARRIMAKLESELITGVSRYINEHPGLSQVVVNIEGELMIENKNRLESGARIVVGGR